MKKLLGLFLALSFILAACGGEAAKPESTGTATVASGDAAKQLVGEWEGIEAGDVLPQYKIGLPMKLIVQEDGVYFFTMTIAGKSATWKGTYTIDTNKNPYWIDFSQQQILDPASGNYVDSLGGKSAKDQSSGIFAFTADGNLQAIFYRKAFFPRPEEIGGSDTLVFKRIK